jgi:spore coat protein CotH
VQTFENVKIKIGGHSTRSWAKVPYKIKISNKSSANGLYGRHHLKLRSEATDPTLVREKLYTDMLASMGVITSKGSYVR